MLDTKERSAGLRARASDVRKRLEDSRPRHPLLDAGFRTVALLQESGGPLLAGAIAFRFFLFIVPFVFVLVMGFGLGADAAHTDVQQIARQAGIVGIAAQAMESGSNASNTTRWVTFVLAAYALILAAMNLLKAMRIAHGLIWKQPTPKLRHPVSSVLGIIVVVPSGIFLLHLTYNLRGKTLIGWLLALAIYTVIPAGLWLACSQWLFPKPSGVTWRHLLPGAVLFGVGIEALQVLTVLWIAPTTQSKSETYGALGAALAILLWAYMLGRLVTLSATLNAVLWRRGRSARHSPPSASVAATIPPSS